MSFTQFFISFAIIMMMLSLVSERASNLIKLYFQDKEIYIPFITKKGKKWSYFIKVKLVILAYKQPTEMAEKEREYRIMIINTLIGIIIACFANASFFEIVQQISASKENVTIEIKGLLINGLNTNIIVGGLYFFVFLWSISLILISRLQEFNIGIEKSVKKKYKYPFITLLVFTIIMLFITEFNICNIKSYINFISIFRHTIGYIITGLFLSLGSKFWHDLLDILFKFKNTQQVLSDPKTYTNYDSADKLVALAETSQYEIAERFFELYKNEIDKIEGVLSYGLNTILEPRTNLFKKIIEVEYNNPETQGKLDRLKYTGSLNLNYNVFYLKDYMVYRYTSDLIAISAINRNPICFAYNANSPDSKGSFSVFEKNNEYFAESNLHVFADDNEFINFDQNQNYELQNLKVYFKIGSHDPALGTVVDYQFGNQGINGIDYCLCSISKSIYDNFQNEIDNNKLQNVTEYEMKMYGSVSKYVDFHTFRQGTMCNVKYNSFTKKLYLYKIGTSTPGLGNVSKGDSGSKIYYKIKNSNNQYQIFEGILVAKSDNYAYMFIK